MRDIKFRAWEPKNKKMYFPSWTMFAILMDRAEEVEEDGIELMQYTGIKDKNGKEIYEGDIIRLYPFDKPNTYVDASISYGAPNFRLYPIRDSSTDESLLVEYDEELNYTNTDEKGNLSFVEVLGNGYENHELIENE